MMGRRLVLIVLAIAGLSTPVQAQLISERLDGMRRVCVYRGPTGILTDTDRTSEYRVGMAENCPGSMPGVSGSPLPPTARLQSEREIGQNRICTFEQAGRIWERSVGAGRSCPMSAGILQAETREPR